MTLIDVYRTFYPNATEHAFFTAPHGTSSKIDHTLGHKANVNKYKKIEINPCILCDHQELKLDINNKNNRKPIWQGGMVNQLSSGSGNVWQRQRGNWDRKWQDVTEYNFQRPCPRNLLQLVRPLLLKSQSPPKTVPPGEQVFKCVPTGGTSESSHSMCQL